MKRKKMYCVFKFKMIAVTFLGVMLMVMLFVMRKEALQGVTDGLLLCGRVVIPSIFPFMAFSGFISKSGAAAFLGRVVSPVFRLLFGADGETASAVLLSFTAGYPVSAKLLLNLCEGENITPAEGRRLLRFCVNPGPAFVITAVGGIMLASIKAGVIIFISVLLASLTVGIFSTKREHRIRKCATVRSSKQVSAADAFCEGCAEACSSVITVCAFTVLFSCISGMISRLPLPDALIRTALPFLEITTGLSGAGNLPLPFFAAFISFGGVSVLFQVFTAARKFGESFIHIVLWRILSALLAFTYSVVLFTVFPVSLNLMPTISAALKTGQGNLCSSMLLIISLCVFLVYIGQLGLSKKTKESNI